ATRTTWPAFCVKVGFATGISWPPLLGSAVAPVTVAGPPFVVTTATGPWLTPVAAMAPPAIANTSAMTAMTVAGDGARTRNNLERSDGSPIVIPPFQGRSPLYPRPHRSL